MAENDMNEDFQMKYQSGGAEQGSCVVCVEMKPKQIRNSEGCLVQIVKRCIFNN